MNPTTRPNPTGSPNDPQLLAGESTEEALRRNERLATAGRLTAAIAHEIRNPLEALTNLVYLAR